MNNTQLPNKADIEELLAFLPILYEKGFKPIKVWDGTTQEKSGTSTIPWSEYDDAVLSFIKVAAKACWCDYGYQPAEVGQILHDENFVKTSSLEQIKTMLTFCVRGERFFDGHWAVMIEDGHIRRLLERLAELGSLMSNS